MQVKEIIVEDFLNYKKPAMFIVSAVCDWKCCREAGLDIEVCQNAPLVSSPTTNVSEETIFKTFVSNDITKAVVIGGLEPMLQFDEVISLINYFRCKHNDCPFVIYTGYNENEITDKILQLKEFSNIIVKFGRFIPNRPHRFDSVLGLELVSDNQYAVQISPPDREVK